MILVDPGRVVNEILLTPDFSKGDIIKVVERVPTIDATPVIHGHWIDHALGFLLSHTTCSRCGFDKDGLSHPNYCEECGAKMDEEADDDDNKPVLDATCGSRTIWFDKSDGRALFVDRREEYDTRIWKSGNGQGERILNVHPDVIADFTKLPFENNTFWHVVFDPPHLRKLGETSWMAKKYGKLNDDWRQVLHDGFSECMRVLKPNGTLIFKWCEFEIPTKQVIDAIGCKPLYGVRSGKQGKTHWMAFIKEVD